MTYSYKYPRPALTADAVVFSHDKDGDTTLLLIRRGNEPYAGCWALPGGFVDEGERTEDAARRELQEETGVTTENPNFRLVGIYDTKGRDPRGWTVSAAYTTTIDGEPYAKGCDDAAEAQWHKISQLPPLAFDHGAIIADAIQIMSV